eukprot:TRINITY_DN4758_c1_g1_i1.p1 TRINITY_DN4758_c1_g1~~TRINITY_DN4758_c1_g1_i1.p1  ORF type:complete len:200 (+),score=-46.05 TRINITY_DN4758_c1_g1_i1:151-750(+)
MRFKNLEITNITNRHNTYIYLYINLRIYYIYHTICILFKLKLPLSRNILFKYYLQLRFYISICKYMYQYQSMNMMYLSQHISTIFNQHLYFDIYIYVCIIINLLLSQNQQTLNLYYLQFIMSFKNLKTTDLTNIHAHTYIYIQFTNMLYHTIYIYTIYQNYHDLETAYFQLRFIYRYKYRLYNYSRLSLIQNSIIQILL